MTGFTICYISVHLWRSYRRWYVCSSRP